MFTASLIRLETVGKTAESGNRHGLFYRRNNPNVTETGWPSKRLADALLEDAGVAALSGTAFGEFGEGYLRFSVANSIENIEKALDRIDAWTKKNL